MSNSIPKYCKHKASGQAVVRINGVDHYLGPHGSAVSKAEYDRLIQEWLASGRRLAKEDHQGLTVNELMAAYWGRCEGYYVKHGQPTSQMFIVKAALGYVRRLYGRKQAAEFGPLALKACRQQMIQDGLARSTINNYQSAITAMFKWAAGNQLLPGAVWQDLRAVEGLRKGRSEARETEPVKPVPAHLVAAVEPFVSRPVWAMIRLQELTGMRPGEVTIMRACDLDMTGRVWLYVPQSHKTEHRDRAREIYLGPQAQDVVRPFLRTDLRAYLFSPVEAEAERRKEQRAKRKSPVQPSQRNRRRPNPKTPPGDRYTTQTYRRAIERGCELAFEMPAELRKIPKRLPAEERERRRELANAWRAENCWSPNQVRHNAGTAARKEGGVELAQIILGHSHADVTQVYAERDRARAIEFIAKFG